MVKLNKEAFNELVDLLAGLDIFRTERDRNRLVDDVLAGQARESVIRGQLDLAGPPRTAAISLVRSFQNFGQVTAGQELLGILANQLLEGYVFDPEPVGFLRGLFDKYPLEQPIAPQTPVSDWRGTTPPAAVQEKIIGENTLRDIRLLELGLMAAQAVVRVVVPDGTGTGFLCGTGVVMTNHHVIKDKASGQQSRFEFFYELDQKGMARQAQVIQPLADGLFFSDSTLDVTLIQVQSPPEGVMPLLLRRAQVQKDDRVSIIQHPGGHFKKISMQNNFVEYADTQVVQYTTSTMLGSSGSPVFNDNFEVVAIHHSGGMLTEPNSDSPRRYYRNGGSSMIAVLQAVQSQAPELYALLRVG